MTDRAHDWVLANGFAPTRATRFGATRCRTRSRVTRGPCVYGGRFNSDALEEHPFLRDEYDWIARSLDADLPMLGICLGAQMIARHLGGDGGAPAGWPDRVRVLRGPPVPGAEDFLPGPMTVTQSHFHGFTLPEDAERLAESDLFPNQAFRYGPRRSACSSTPRPPMQFRRWQDAYPGHYDRPGCQSRADQDAMIDEGAGRAGGVVRRHRCSATSSRIASNRKGEASVRRSAASCVSSGMDGSARGVSGARSPSGGPSRRKRATCLGV
jgi:GMP synthase (glutamine-hydrolysing)